MLNLGRDSARKAIHSGLKMLGWTTALDIGRGARRLRRLAWPDPVAIEAAGREMGGTDASLPDPYVRTAVEVTFNATS